MGQGLGTSARTRATNVRDQSHVSKVGEFRTSLLIAATPSGRSAEARGARVEREHRRPLGVQPPTALGVIATHWNGALFDDNE
jgi:hypothetical protein